MTKPSNNVKQSRRLREIRLGDTKVNPRAQRDLRPFRVDHLVSEFDIDKLDTPHVSHRDGHYWIIDGQHRIEALKVWLGAGWEDQKLAMWVYEGLTSEQEADHYLALNDKLAQPAMAKFHVAVHAGRPDESDVDRIVRANGMVVSLSETTVPSIGAVGTLMRVYRRSDGATLGRALRILRDSYGQAGLQSHLIDGVGLLCQRFNGEVDDAHVVERLSAMPGGPTGLTGQAERMRAKFGGGKGPAVAAAVIEQVNKGRGGKNLPSWWK